MHDKCGADELAVAEFINHDAADDDAKAESGEASASNVTELSTGEAELGRPVGEDASANTEADAGGEDGEEAGPEEPLSVWRCVECVVCHRVFRVNLELIGIRVVQIYSIRFLMASCRMNI